eukprot:TRINITY_DN13713_c0_g1_i1.p1 TRINITY_DN13713_c0_g1~~TRINITY_DN13713_c0_g1_i1.p1  ORF type:complete len:1144 (+),score=201.46 TRINITY_DN13713_c0_g1_i1:134-3565(+)
MADGTTPAGPNGGMQAPEQPEDDAGGAEGSSITSRLLRRARAASCRAKSGAAAVSELPMPPRLSVPSSPASARASPVEETAADDPLPVRVDEILKRLRLLSSLPEQVSDLQKKVDSMLEGGQTAIAPAAVCAEAKPDKTTPLQPSHSFRNFLPSLSSPNISAGDVASPHFALTKSPSRNKLLDSGVVGSPTMLTSPGGGQKGRPSMRPAASLLTGILNQTQRRRSDMLLGKIQLAAKEAQKAASEKKVGDGGSETSPTPAPDTSPTTPDPRPASPPVSMNGSSVDVLKVASIGSVLARVSTGSPLVTSGLGIPPEPPLPPALIQSQESVLNRAGSFVEKPEAEQPPTAVKPPPNEQPDRSESLPGLMQGNDQEALQVAEVEEDWEDPQARTWRGEGQQPRNVRDMVEQGLAAMAGEDEMQLLQEVMDEASYFEENVAKFMLLPDQRTRRILDSAFFLVSIFEVIYVSLAVTTDQWHTPPETAIVALLWMITAFHSGFVCAEFRTAFLDGWELVGDEVDEVPDVHYHYLFGWLKYDLLTSLPYDLVALLCGSVWTFRVLSCVRMTRILRTPILFGKSNPLSQNPTWIKALYFVVYYVIGIHVISCVFMRVQRAEDESWNSEYQNSTADEYIAALYFTVTTMTTVGYGDISANTTYSRAFAIVAMVIGVSVYAYVMANVATFLRNEDHFERQIAEKKRSLASVMQHYDIPLHVQKEAFCIYPAIIERIIANSEETMRELPDFMQVKLYHYMKINLVRKVPLFRAANQECLSATAMACARQIQPPKTFLVEAGDVGHEMFIIVSGVVEVFVVLETGERKWLANLKDGSWFGEMALLYEGTTRSASVRALTACELLRLERSEFRRILERFQDLRSAIEEEADARRQAAARHSKCPTSYDDDTQTQTTTQIESSGSSQSSEEGARRTAPIRNDSQRKRISFGVSTATSSDPCEMSSPGSEVRSGSPLRPQQSLDSMRRSSDASRRPSIARALPSIEGLGRAESRGSRAASIVSMSSEFGGLGMRRHESSMTAGGSPRRRRKPGMGISRGAAVGNIGCGIDSGPSVGQVYRRRSIAAQDGVAAPKEDRLSRFRKAGQRAAGLRREEIAKQRRQSGFGRSGTDVSASEGETRRRSSRARRRSTMVSSIPI